MRVLAALLVVVRVVRAAWRAVRDLDALIRLDDELEE